MAKRYHHRRRRHNPLGISGQLVKDVGFNVAGAAGSAWVASMVGQSGWVDVAVTGGAAVGISLLGKGVLGPGGAEEFLKGGVLVTLLKALSQFGFAVPGLSGMGLYVNSYYSAPTNSDAYGRAQAPTIMLPAPTAQKGGKGTSGMGYQRFRSRYQTRF
jgi:hypothetical protein